MVGLGVAIKIAATKHVSLALVPIQRQTINELQPIQFKIPIRSEGIPESAFRYRLVSGPAGAAVDPKRGKFAWMPTEEQGPGEYEVRIEVQADLPEPRKLEGRFKIKVLEVAQSPVVKPIDNRTANPGQKIELGVQANDPDLPASPLTFRVQCSPQVTRGPHVEVSNVLPIVGLS